ncbi:Z-ring formation inhibitor MciZ [Paenibacillus kobensis]|nr:Z-ring formation inhibitor MciZ [Paenibacillus kobensis]
MKSYYANESFRMVGKAWEIRRMLEAMTRRSDEPTSLAEYLKRRNPKR